MDSNNIYTYIIRGGKIINEEEKALYEKTDLAGFEQAVKTQTCKMRNSHYIEFKTEFHGFTHRKNKQRGMRYLPRKQYTIQSQDTTYLYVHKDKILKTDLEGIDYFIQKIRPDQFVNSNEQLRKRKPKKTKEIREQQKIRQKEMLAEKDRKIAEARERGDIETVLKLTTPRKKDPKNKKKKGKGKYPQKKKSTKSNTKKPQQTENKGLAKEISSRKTWSYYDKS